jgi:hypothetical protein
VKAAVALALACFLGACRGSGAKTHRGSGAPVEMVQAPVLPDAGSRGSGAVTDEIEPNDAADVATPLALGTSVRGKIENKSEAEPDVDRYRIDIDKPGVLAVTVSGVEGQDLILEIEDGGGTVVAKSDRPGARVKEGVPNLGVTPGRYTAVVRAVPKKKPPKPARPARGKRGAAPPPEPPPGPAPAYEISAQLVQPAANAEREPDDDRGTANDLIVGDAAVTGFVGWTDDRDVWKLAIETLSAKNAIDVEISAIEGTALELEIADGIGAQLADRKAPRGAPLIVRGLVPVVPPGGTPFHYLTVRGAPSNPETAYQLRVTAHVVEVDAEVEPDDTPEHAFPFPADRRVVYATWTPGDVDCFALPVTAGPRTVEVVAKPTQGDPDLSLEVIVDGKSVAVANKAGRGAEEKATVQVPAGARAVIRVKGTDAGTANEAKYDLNVNESE